MLIRRKVNLSEVLLQFMQHRAKISEVAGEEPKMYLTTSDFAPEGYKVGDKVIDPETMLKGEVIGYDEWDILLPVSEE